MKILKSTVTVKSAPDDVHLEKYDAIRDYIEGHPDVLVDLVNLLFSEQDMFADNVFMTHDIFYNLISHLDTEEVADKFYRGHDLDSHRGAAYPNAKYFRYDAKGNFESTNHPDQIYNEEIFQDVVDYVIDHPDNERYPEEIIDILAN